MHEHAYEKLNEQAIYCRTCGDIKGATEEDAVDRLAAALEKLPTVPCLLPHYPAVATCSVCGQPMYPGHYHWTYYPTWTMSHTTSSYVTMTSES